MAKAPVRGRKTPLLNKPTRDYERPSNEVREPAPNFDLLTEEDKADIRAKAEAKYIDEEKQRAWDAFLEAEAKRLDKEAHPEAYEEMKEIEIEVAVYPPVIMLDGKAFWHGRRYTVKKSVYDTLASVMYGMKKHWRDNHRDPAQVMQEAAQATAKGGSSYATISANGPGPTF